MNESKNEVFIDRKICVSKNSTVLLEMQDRLLFDDSAMAANVELNGSRIRFIMQSYGTAEKQKAYKNLTTIAVKQIRDKLNRLDEYDFQFTKTAIEGIEKLKKMVSNNPGVEESEIRAFDNLIKKLENEIEEKSKSITVYSEKNILPYEQYKNPNNDNQYLTTGILITYNRTMNNPIMVRITNGYANLNKRPSGQITFTGEQVFSDVKKYLSVGEFVSMIDQTCQFANSMYQLAINGYFYNRTHQA